MLQSQDTVFLFMSQKKFQTKKVRSRSGDMAFILDTKNITEPSEGVFEPLIMHKSVQCYMLTVGHILTKRQNRSCMVLQCRYNKNKGVKWNKRH